MNEQFMSVLESSPAPKGSFKKGLIIGGVIILICAFIVFVFWKLPKPSVTIQDLDARLKVVESKGCLVQDKDGKLQPILCSQR